MNIAKTIILMVCFLNTNLFYLSTSALAQSAPPVPSTYTATYSGISSAVDTFITSLDKRAQVQYSTRLGSGLDQARGAQGFTLLTAGAIGNVEEELNRFQQLGIPAVTISIEFPALCQEFWTQSLNNSQGFSQMLNFYKEVMVQCRKRGLKVLIEAHTMGPGTDIYGSAAYNFTSTLSSGKFQQFMAEHQGNIANYLCPDVISIVDEPDTDLGWTGQQAYKTPQNLAAFVQAMANNIAQINAANHTNILAAAGADSWMTNALTYNNLFCQIPTLGAIDIHTYFAGGNDLEFLTMLADSAHAAGRAVVVSECWLTKTGNVQPVPSAPQGAGQAVAARAINSFSFWQPLDEKFMSALVKWCKVENPQIFVFFYPQLLFAYLDYNTQPLSNDQQIVNNELQAEQAAMNADQFSAIGFYYAQLLRAQGSSTPPTLPPAPPTAVRPLGAAPAPGNPSAPPIVVHPSQPSPRVPGKRG